MRKVAALAAAIFLPACLRTTPGHDFIPTTLVVVNNPDSFTVSITGFNSDENVNAAWSCGAPQANLTIGSSMSSGTVHIVITDAASVVVYDNTHQAIGGLNVQTRPGTPGTWTVFIDFDNATIAGAITLDADTAPADVDQVTVGSAFGTSDYYTFHAAWGAVAADLNIGSVNAGSLVINIWHGGQDPSVDVPFFTSTVGSGGLIMATPMGSTGVWTIELDFSGAQIAGSLSITSP